MDLKSDLSWYGKEAPGFTPNTDKTDTRFDNSGASPAVSITGYNNNGDILAPVSKIASDSFVIDDATYSDRGFASRAAQLGAGTNFPTGPAGEHHSFDKVRIGFSPDARYSDAYGVKFENAGLADTYTANSPIDDMYNKFNLRDDATPNPGYVKQPFILRGIQREDKSDPQRWGLGETTVGKIFSTFDLPRAGILTSAERSAIDTVRIGKFLISPKGIGFLARQFGYQLMNPNIENLAGTALNLPATQLYNPLSAPGQALVGGILGVGKFTRHSSLTALPLGGGGEYGLTKGLQRAGNLLLGMDGPKALGRMVKLYKQWDRGDGFLGQEWAALSAPKGPGSILGIGKTTHRRAEITDLARQKGFTGGIPDGVVGDLKALIGKEPDAKTLYNTSFDDTFARYNNSKPYKDYPNVNDGDGYKDKLDNTEFNGGGRNEPDTARQEVDFTGYKTNAYEEFPERKPTDTNTNDFRTGEDYVSNDDEVANVDERFRKSDDFRGGGAEENVDESGTPKVGRSRFKTNSYEQLTNAAENRPADSTTDWNFQKNDTQDNTARIEGENALVKRTKDQVEDSETPPEAPFEERIGEEEALKTDKSGPLQPQEKGYYKVLGYRNLRRDNVRSFSSGKSSKGALGGSYGGETLESKYGYKKFDANRTSIKSQPDRVTSTQQGDEEDLIIMQFQALRTTDSLNRPKEDPIQFRAYLNSLNDSFAPSWQENQDQGRADAKIMLEGWGRSISLDFIVPVQSEQELRPVYQKLERLAKLTYPIYPRGGSGFTGTYCKTTIGDLYKGEAMYVTDLSYDWDNETPWEIKRGQQLPFYTSVSMTLGWIGKHRPEYNSYVFTCNSRG